RPVVGPRSGGIDLVMEPVSIEAAIEKAKKKGLRPGRVKGTNGIQFTKGRNERIEVISWDEFRTTLTERELQVFDSGGFMKIMKKSAWRRDPRAAPRPGPGRLFTHLGFRIRSQAAWVVKLGQRRRAQDPVS